MKKLFIILLLAISCCVVYGQNFSVGTTAPVEKLNGNGNENISVI